MSVCACVKLWVSSRSRRTTRLVDSAKRIALLFARTVVLLATFASPIDPLGLAGVLSDVRVTVAVTIAMSVPGMLPTRDNRRFIVRLVGGGGGVAVVVAFTGHLSERMGVFW